MAKKTVMKVGAAESLRPEYVAQAKRIAKNMAAIKFHLEAAEETLAGLSDLNSFEHLVEILDELLIEADDLKEEMVD